MKNQLDEMQEQKLLKIERNMAWLAFWGLLIAMAVQMFAYGADIKSVLGEWLLFMTLCVYMVTDCLRNGIWDRKLKPEPKTNFLCSLAGAVVTAAVVGVMVYRTTGSLKAVLLVAAIVFAVMLALCYAALAWAVKVYKKRLETMDNACDETES